MKIIKFCGAGDIVLAETDVIEEAEKILKEYETKKFSIWDDNGNNILPLKTPLPDKAFILFPMSGGSL